MHVVAGALVRAGDEVLVARRPEGAHQGGRWEFPGGKLEPGEARRAGLARELREELGVEVERARPLIRIDHDYRDRAVRLDVWRVEGWRGEPRGREGQPIAWRAIAALEADAFPAADVPVLHALALPERYLVTPEPGPEPERFLRSLARSLAAGPRLVQLRARSLDTVRLETLARAALAVCRAAGARMLVNGPPDLAAAVGADGVHLTAARLARAVAAPLARPHAGFLVGASCHDAAEIARAAAVGADLAVLGPVRATASHPGATPLGWAAFERLALAAALPVYALGGVGEPDLDEAWARGGQGIAAIRGLWSG